MECVRLFRFHVTATRNEAYLKPYPQEMLDYWFAMPAWMWIIWAVGVFGALAGSLALLMRKRLAVGLFLASFLAAAVSMTTGISTRMPRAWKEPSSCPSLSSASLSC